MKESTSNEEIGESDVTTAIKSLDEPSFRARFMRTDCNATDPEWKSPDGRAIGEHVRDQMTALKRQVEATRLHHFHGRMFQKFASDTLFTISIHDLLEPVAPTARDLLHVYGPDRDNTKDWRRYYRYAWRDQGPHAILYSSESQIIQKGELACSSYSYSGQNSYALVGAGMFFRPQFGDAKLLIKPYVQWLTSASFTGNPGSSASATAYLGIYVQSWAQSGGAHYVDRDHWIPVWSQTRQNFATGVTAEGAAAVNDGLFTEILAVTQRKYAIYVYAYLETSVAPQQRKNENRFVTIDIDATVPFVVIEEDLN